MVDVTDVEEPGTPGAVQGEGSSTPTAAEEVVETIPTPVEEPKSKRQKVDQKVEQEPSMPEPERKPNLTHVVLRPFVGAGVERVPGEVVDASGWRMANHLVLDRRLRAFGRDDSEPVTDGQGRYFIDDDTLLAYIDSIVPETIEEN